MTKLKRVLLIVFVIAAASALAACGSSRENLATRTAEMQTATATLLTPTLTVTPSATLTPTTDQRYYQETAGEISFSYIPPMGWFQDQSGNHPLMGWCWKDETGETPYCQLFFALEKSDLPLEQYVHNFQQEIETTDSVLTEAPFTTDSKTEAAKVEASLDSSTDPDSKTYAAFYLFHRDGFFVIAIYSRGFNVDKTQDPIVDASMRTFRFDE